MHEINKKANCDTAYLSQSIAANEMQHWEWQRAHSFDFLALHRKSLIFSSTSDVAAATWARCLASNAFAPFSKRHTQLISVKEKRMQLLKIFATSINFLRRHHLKMRIKTTSANVWRLRLNDRTKPRHWHTGKEALATKIYLLLCLEVRWIIVNLTHVSHNATTVSLLSLCSAFFGGRKDNNQADRLLIERSRWRNPTAAAWPRWRKYQHSTTYESTGPTVTKW